MGSVFCSHTRHVVLVAGQSVLNKSTGTPEHRSRSSARRERPKHLPTRLEGTARLEATAHPDGMARLVGSNPSTMIRGGLHKGRTFQVEPSPTPHHSTAVKVLIPQLVYNHIVQHTVSDMLYSSGWTYTAYSATAASVGPCTRSDHIITVVEFVLHCEAMPHMTTCNITGASCMVVKTRSDFHN